MSLVCESQLRFWRSATAEELRAYLVNDVAYPEQGLRMMEWLAANRPDIANRVLCYFYDVACYCVGDSCFKESTPKEEHGKWFASVLPISGLRVDDVPLADSLEECEKLAVKHLGLMQRFTAPVPEFID